MSTIVANRIESLQSGQTTFTATPYVVSFFAYEGSSNTGSGTLIYTLTQHNIGSAYDASTGKFTAPIKGVYTFSCNVLRSGGDGNVAFKVNDGHAFLSNNSTNDRIAQYVRATQYDHGSLTANFQLNANDTVSVVTTSTLTVYGNYSHFSGHLIGAIE